MVHGLLVVRPGVCSGFLFCDDGAIELVQPVPRIRLREAWAGARNSRMSFLPLVERELRVTSRRKGTYWIRCGAALLGALFLLPALAVASVSGPRSGAGAVVFNCMAWYGAVACTLAGAFLGAD